MSIFYVYKTKKNLIFVVGLGSKNDEGDIKIWAFDHNIPPSPAKLIGVFKADVAYDYTHQMIPILLENLEKDTVLRTIYENTKEEGL